MGERHNEGVVPDPGDNSDSYIHVPSPLLSVSSIQTESMGRDAVMECAGVTSPVPAEGCQDPLFMEGQRLRESAEFSEPSSTEDWVRQAMVAMKMAPCKYKLQTGIASIASSGGGGRWGHVFRIENNTIF